MLDRCAPEPDRALGVVDEETAACVDCDLVAAEVGVDVVVRGPLPYVLQVHALCAGCDVHGCVRGVAFCVELVFLGFWAAGGDWARGALKVGTNCSADARVHVPHARGRGRGGGEIPFD